MFWGKPCASSRRKVPTCSNVRARTRFNFMPPVADIGVTYKLFPSARRVSPKRQAHDWGVSRRQVPRGASVRAAGFREEGFRLRGLDRGDASIWEFLSGIYLSVGNGYLVREMTDWDTSRGGLGALARFSHDHYYLAFAMFISTVASLSLAVFLLPAHELCVPGNVAPQMQVCKISVHSWNGVGNRYSFRMLRSATTSETPRVTHRGAIRFRNQRY